MKQSTKHLLVAIICLVGIVAGCVASSFYPKITWLMCLLCFLQGWLLVGSLHDYTSARQLEGDDS